MKNRASLRKMATILGLVSCIAGAAFATTAPSMSPDEALQKLMAGNQRYVKNQMTGSKLCDVTTRKALANSQKPYAIILSCSDSRIPPELVFDQGLGEIFVVRVAGNIIDPVVLGSIEYAAEHLGSPVIMVLGHERCGAVTATVNAKGKPEGNIGAIVKAISPSVQVAAKDCKACNGDAKCKESKKDEFIECAITTNVKLVSKALTKKSPVLKHLADQKKIKIIAAKYDLDDGLVTVLQ